MAEETCLHAVIGCEEIHWLWFLCRLGIRFESCRDHDLRKWCREFVAKATLEAVELLAVITHGICMARNKLVFEDRILEPNLIVSRAICILYTYQHPHVVENGNRASNIPTHDQRILWRPPPEGCAKLNVDAAPVGSLDWGVGVIIRDEEGQCLAAATWNICCGNDSRFAECMAMRLGLMFAKDLCFQRLVAESDNLEVIQAINRKKDHPTYFYSLINECVEIGSSFSGCNFVHTTRQGNMVAHRLAKYACKRICMEESPPVVTSLVQSDCTHLVDFQ